MKNYEELSFVDDYMFCTVLSNHLDLCKELLELILRLKINRVENAVSQKSVSGSYSSKGVRFDVYVEDDAETIYDIEMQTTLSRDLPKRARYYQSMIDMDNLKKGVDYSKLRKSYVIFICLDDPFGDNLAIYNFTKRCEQNLSLALGDDTSLVVVNAAGNRSGLSSEMVGFLDFLKNSATSSVLTRKLQTAVDGAIANEEWRSGYMTLEMKLREVREESLAEGRAEGRADDIERMLRAGKTPEQIADFCGYELADVMEIQNKIAE